MPLINDDFFNKKIARSNLPSEVKEKIKDKVEKITAKSIQDEIKSFKNKKRIIENDASKTQIKADTELTEEQITSLPSWVKNDIQNAVIIGNSKQVVQIKDGRKYHLKNKLNHLSGAEWTFFINSIINTRFSTTGNEGFAHNIRKIHPSPKPPQLMQSIIEFFTKEKEFVLDYFSGVGGSLLGASLSNRRAIGIDLENKYHDAYREASIQLGLNLQHTITGDSVNLLKNGRRIKKLLKDEEVSLILIDPPYGNMMSREKTGQAVKNGNISATPFTEDTKDLGNMNWQDFCKVFKSSLEHATRYLKDEGHIVIFIKDLQPDGDELNLLHADLIKITHSINGVNYLGTKIWADQSVNLYPYGYPYSYVSNQIHQYILIFKYRKSDKS